MLRRIRLAQVMMDNACRKVGRCIRIMETCSTHTTSIFRNAIRESVPAGLKIISGPGCSVCATDPAFMEQIFTLANKPDVIVAGRSDLLNVPVNHTLSKMFELNNTTAVTSVLEALELARIYPDKTIVFASVGFETCAPGMAVAIELAEKEGLKNFCAFSGIKKIVPAMQMLLREKNENIDAFLCCGNMAALTGYDTYKPIMEEFNVPCLPVGVEPMQLIEGIAEICRQLSEGDVRPSYDFAVSLTDKGNLIARRYVQKYFDSADCFWRGLGKIENSALKLKPEYELFDACKRFDIKEIAVQNITGCRCGEVLCGLIEPRQCPMYGNKCTRKNPIGPCMACVDGICSAWARYSRKDRL